MIKLGGTVARLEPELSARRNNTMRAAAMLPRLRDVLEPMVAHRFFLDEVVAAFDTALDKSTRSIKAQIHS